MNFRAFLNTLGTRSWSLPIVIFYVTEGCNLKCVMCSYRDPLPGELSSGEIEALAQSLASLGLKHIVYSGGEPLMRQDFPAIARTFGRYDVRQTLLTNGLLLEKRIPELERNISEIIVSLDGANAATHNSIRGVDSFDRILSGIHAARKMKYRISIRTVLQKQNYRELSELVALAKEVGVERISFLAVDTATDAFGRRASVNAGNTKLLLDHNEVREFRDLVEEFVESHRDDFSSGFISESPQKILHIVEYFEAYAGVRKFPRNVCNAPMVSTVITSTGEVRPCFFLPSFGNVRNSSVKSLLNTPSIRKTRADVKAFRPAECQRCVCTLHIRPQIGLLHEL